MSSFDVEVIVVEEHDRAGFHYIDPCNKDSCLDLLDAYNLFQQMELFLNKFFCFYAVLENLLG